MADILLSYVQRIVLKAACEILQTPPEGFPRGLWPLYLLGRKGSISIDDLGLIAGHLPSIIDRLRSASDESFLVELAMRISDKDTSFDEALAAACRRLATGEGLEN